MEFKISFLELMVLSQNCIPPTNVPRTLFWRKLIDEHYKLMSDEQRIKLYKWMRTNSKYLDGLKDEHWIQVFDGRYNPETQYKVTIVHLDGKYEVIDVFLVDDRYHLDSETEIGKDWIINVNKKEVTCGYFSQSF
jgi:hypothetical protein